MTSDGLALQHVPAEFQADRGVVLKAMKQNSRALFFASQGLKHDKNLQHIAAVSVKGKAAVTDQRAEVDIAACLIEGSKFCVASFPGAFIVQWGSLMQCCEPGRLSSACVFLPPSDPERRFGQHRYNPDTPGKCFCHALYGDAKDWGCRWFADWSANIEEAVHLNLPLLVVFFPGEKDEGIIEWHDLAQEGRRLWSGIGLGGSQKGEVAWLRRNGYAFTSLDVLDVLDFVDSASA